VGEQNRWQNMSCLPVRVSKPFSTLALTTNRVSINPDDLQRFTMKQDREKNKPPPKPVDLNQPVPKSTRQISYNIMGTKLAPFISSRKLTLPADRDILSDIQSMETFGDYGNKIQTLVQHLLYIQENEPGAKSIIFSAWADSLISVLC
jgi:E3 ubiquitin-protein ligase SHPRH